MKNILRIDSSLFAEASVSQQLADELIATLKQQYGEISLVTRDLGETHIPHIDGNWISALSTDETQRTPEQKQIAAFANELVSEIQQADIVVIGAPMYNFSVPSVLKAWFDHITQAGVTFSYTSKGPEGLLTGKTAYVITTRGGLHKDKPSDTQVPYIKNILQFIGINDTHIIYAEGLNMGGDHRQHGIAQARQTIQIVAA